MYEHLPVCVPGTHKMSHHPDLGAVGGSNPSTAGGGHLPSARPP